MCAICKDWSIGKLTTAEAWRNLDETKDVGFETDEELVHYFEVAELLSVGQDESES
jgi:hypothetical protein